MKKSILKRAFKNNSSDINIYVSPEDERRSTSIFMYEAASVFSILEEYRRTRGSVISVETRTGCKPAARV